MFSLSDPRESRSLLRKEGGQSNVKILAPAGVRSRIFTEGIQRWKKDLNPAPTLRESPEPPGYQRLGHGGRRAGDLTSNEKGAAAPKGGAPDE